MLSWYCAQTHTGSERIAVVNLNRQSFRTVLPLGTEDKRVGGKTTTVIVPLFPRYVFTQFDIDKDRWSAVNSTIGVKRLVSFGPKPAVVPDGVVEPLIALQQLVLEQKILVPIRLDCRVRVVSGPLAGKDGDDTIGICKWTNGQRVKLLMDIMQRRIEIEFDVADVEAVPDPVNTPVIAAT